MKLRYHTRDGKTEIEIEGSPIELAHYTHELERRRTAHQDSTSIKTTSNSELEPESSDPDLRARLLSLSSRAVEDYILALPPPGMDHTIKDISMHFVGRPIASKKQQTEYLNLFSKVKRAHVAIESKMRGSWVKDKKLGQDGNTYVVYRFKKDDGPL